MVVTIGDLVDAAIAILPEEKRQVMERHFALDRERGLVTLDEIENMVRAMGARKGILDAPWGVITKAIITKMPWAAQQELARWNTASMGREDVAWMAACTSLELRRFAAAREYAKNIGIEIRAGSKPPGEC